MTDNPRIQWRQEAIEAATRVICCGLPIEVDGETDLHKIARGICMAPDCPCWEDGKRVTKTALDVAAHIEIDRCPVPTSGTDGTATDCIAKGNCGCNMGDRLVAGWEKQSL